MGSEQSVMATPLPDFQPPQDAQDVSDALFSDMIHEDSFLSCESFAFGNSGGSQMVLDRSVPQSTMPDEEFCKLVNFANLRTLVAASSVRDQGRNNLQFNTLYDLMNSNHVSCNYQGCVTACAAFIISYLKFCGKVIPFGTSLLNDKTSTMIKVLNKLNDVLSEIKPDRLKNQHMKNLSNEKQCCDCTARELLLNQVNLFNLSAHETFCLVCLTTVPEKDEASHNSSELHSKIKDLLHTHIYPYACSYCSARFNKTCDLRLHMGQHETSENLAQTVPPFFCCYLCKTAYQNEIDLIKHNMLSVEHACKKELAMEAAWRLNIVKDTQTVLNSPQKDNSIQKETKQVQEEDLEGTEINGTELSVSFGPGSLSSSESTLDHSSSPYTNSEVDCMNWPVSQQNRKESISAQSETALNSKKRRKRKSLEFCDKDGNNAQRTYSVPNLPNCIDICDEASSPVNVFQNILCPKNVVKESEKTYAFEQNETAISSQSHHSEASSSQTLGLEVLDRCESPEFEAECGSCGGLFKIYNNDVKLSMDIHIQSDAQHSLAVDTPNFAVAEAITSTPNPSSAVGCASTTVPKIEELKQAKATVKDSITNNVDSYLPSSWILTNDHSLAQFILKEVECLEYLQPNLVCKICGVKVPLGDSQLNHVWGEPHLKNLVASYQSISVWETKLTMITRWETHMLNTMLKDRIPMLNQLLCCVNKYKQIISLKFRSFEYKCAVCEINVSTADRAIHEAGTDHKHNLQSYVCQVCDVPVSRGNTKQHEAGYKHKMNLQSYSYVCQVCEVPVSRGNIKQHEAGNKHKMNLQSYSYQVCDVPVPRGHKQQHKAGMNHRKNLEIVQENKLKQTDQSNLKYYCGLCDKHMHINDKKNHKYGMSHQSRKGQQ